MQQSPEQQINNREGGFIKIILIIVILIVILSLLKIDIRGIIESPTFQSNFTYLKEAVITVWGWLVQIWTTYLKEPVVYLIGYIQSLSQK